MQSVTADIDQLARGGEFLLIIPGGDGLEDETGSGQTHNQDQQPYAYAP
jgi:hypothetical protein